MSNSKKSGTTSETKSSAAASSSSTGIKRQIDKELTQGFRGTEVDPTPNENYTVAGVTSGAPTPETDAGLAKEVRTETGVGLSALEAAEREKKQRGEK